MRRSFQAAASPELLDTLHDHAYNKASNRNVRNSRKGWRVPGLTIDLSVYNSEAALTGGQPTKKVAEKMHIAPSTASKWVRRCREMGLIPPARR